MVREIVTSENREEYIEKKMNKGRAKKGGEIAESNKAHYKGGQFLPTTSAEPGKWKVGKKWITAGKQETEPGKYEHQPTPLSRSLHDILRFHTAHDKETNTKTLHPHAKNGLGEPIKENTEIVPGIRGNLTQEKYPIKHYINEYNKGNRWYAIQPSEEVIKHKE